MAVGIAVVAEGIFVVVMVLRFRMSAINISEFFVPLAYSVVLITFGMYELDLGSKQLTINSTGISCKSVLKRQYIRWTEVHDYGICYSGETRYKGATYNLYFSKNVQTLKNSRTKKLDMNTHENNPEYKYVGILVETDPTDPNKYYIVNGQTGKRMTWREAEDFPTTLSDEWKDMGLACAPSDAKDVIVPDECRDEAKCIDTSKLESLLKEQIVFDLSLLQKGEKATDSETAGPVRSIFMRHPP